MAAFWCLRHQALELTPIPMSSGRIEGNEGIRLSARAYGLGNLDAAINFLAFGPAERIF